MGDLILKNVEKYFDGKMACSQINLAINKGEFFTFLGPSGCGKTTILRLIAGFIKPQKGTIHLGGRDITGLAPEKRQVGMVFQNYALFPFLTVYQNIEYGLAIQKKPAQQIQSTIAHYMELIGLKGFDHRNIADLSGGEQQRVALARSLAVQPRVLLLDEPLSNLDARLRDKMRMEIKSLQKKLRITTVFVTHDQTEALTLSDRIAVFDQGRIVQVGTPKEIYATPKNAFVAGFIGNTNLFEAIFKDKKASIAGTLDIQLAKSQKKGRYLSIRPQDIILSTTDPGEAGEVNTFKGCLKECQLNGVWIDYIVRVKGIDFRVAALNTLNQGVDFLPEEDVFISLPKNAITILDN